MNARISCLIVSAFVCAATAPVAIAQDERPRIAVAASDDDEQQRTPASPGELLGTLQLVRLDLAIEDAPVRTVLNELRAVLGINIVARYRTERISNGLDPDAPITLYANNLPARVVLEMVLDQAADVEPVTWQLRQGFVEAGPKSRLNVHKEVRVYDVHDLLFEPAYFGPETGYGAPQQIPTQTAAPVSHASHGYGTGFGTGFGGIGFSAPIYHPGPFFRQPPRQPGATSRHSRDDQAEDLVNLITQSIEPQLWERNGGNVASLSYRDGALIVRAPDYVHRMLAGYNHRMIPPAPEASENAADQSD